MERSAVKRVYEIEQNLPIENISFTGEDNIARIEGLEQEKREMQFLYDKLRGEF